MKHNSSTANAIKSKQLGFTLMEMIGVMAVIAILASAAAPPIFEAIEDAKVSAYVQEIHELKLAAARYYKDTGKWPRHVPTSTNSTYHNLMVSDVDGKGGAIPGWNGPYLDRELTHQIVKGANQDVIATADANYTCDLDGDGTRDGTFLVYRADNISDKVAEKISNVIDGDGGITTGDNRWQAAGKIKRYGSGSDHANILLYCITTV